MIVLKRLRIHAFKQTRDVEIWFPRWGSLLIEGQNEAGKSTLFEAVYFSLYGSPLVGEDTRATLEDLIPHGGASASVELTVVAGNTELDIRRNVGFGRSGRQASQQARVIVRRPGAPREEIHGPRPVNARILRELHGLDADTLRNSCFMEQKALDRLESLSRSQREVAIARLLGLDHLQHVARTLESESGELRRQLETLRGELEVAVWQGRASEANERVQQWEIHTAAADIRSLIGQRDAVDGAATGKSERVTSLREQMRNAERRVSEAERMKALLEQVQALRELLQSALAARQHRDQLVEEQARLNRMDREEAQPLADRLARLTELEETLSRQREADAELADVQELLFATERLKEARLASESELRRLAGLEARCVQLDLRERLHEWIQITERAALLATDGTDRNRLVLARDDAQRVERQYRRQARVALIGTCALLLTALAGGAGGFVWAPLWGVAGIAMLLCFVFGLRWDGARRQMGKSQEVSQQARDALTRFDVRAEVSRGLPSTPADLASVDSALRGAGITPPASLAEAKQRLEESSIPDQLSLAEAREAREQARSSVADREARLRATEEQVAALHQRFGPRLDRLLTLQEQAGAWDEVHATRTQLAATAVSLATAMEVTLDEGALARERGAAEARLRLLRDQLVRRVSLTEEIEIEIARAELHDHAHELCSQLTSVIADARALDIEAIELTAPVDDLDRLELAWKTLHATIATAYIRLGEGSERERLAGLASRVEELERSAGETGMDRASAVQALRAAFATQGVACRGDEPLNELRVLWPPLARPALADTDIEAALLNARNEAFHARETAARSAKARGLEGIILDAEERRERVTRCESELRRHEIAAQMAAETQAHIFRRVLPETALHMRALLPELTEGRYRDVELVADENSGVADLKIRVWDQMAGRYVAKNLFSGGARDQFSLALRLAFALATLPKEVGATPGFVFLDEPLSSFDGERSRALVEILTTGAIARQFAQVLLVSHSRSFDYQRFTYRLRMAGGRIVESNLPEEREAERLWAAESAIMKRAE